MDFDVNLRTKWGAHKGLPLLTMTDELMPVLWVHAAHLYLALCE